MNFTNPIHAIIAKVEADHFRTVHDSGAHEKARLVLNAFRHHAGLPYIHPEDLPTWDGHAYVMPPLSKLLTNPNRPEPTITERTATILAKLPPSPPHSMVEDIVQAAIDKALAEANEAHDRPRDDE